LSTPALEEQIKALRLIKKSLPKDVPVIMTVFSPLDIAEKLVDRDQALLKSHIDNDPESLLYALESITETFEKFVLKLITEGIDGIYFSTKWANQGRMKEGQYEQLGKPFDLRILNAARQLWCNIMHVCEDKIRLSVVSDYPVEIFHWDKDAGHNPTYGEGKKQTGRACSGGVNAKVLAFGTKKEIIDSALQAIHDTEGKGFILGPGCSAQMGFTADENFIALRSAVDML
jgi:uroporphyrinogen decarboxylase